MSWSKRTGPHGVSVNEHEVAVWTGHGRHGNGGSVSHFQFLDGEYNGLVLTQHDLETLDRARTECLKYLHQDTFDAIRRCMDDCEDNYAACIDKGGSEEACQAERTQCERQCEYAELQRAQAGGDVESR
jgi:hypothetical protein